MGTKNFVTKHCTIPPTPPSPCHSLHAQHIGTGLLQMYTNKAPQTAISALQDQDPALRAQTCQTLKTELPVHLVGAKTQPSPQRSARETAKLSRPPTRTCPWGKRTGSAKGENRNTHAPHQVGKLKAHQTQRQDAREHVRTNQAKMIRKSTKRSHNHPSGKTCTGRGKIYQTTSPTTCTTITYMSQMK